MCNFALEAAPATEPGAAKETEHSRVTYDSYILGPGDSLQIELLDIPELSGTFSIGPDGTIYLPRLRALYVEGLTVEELRYFLTEQFKTYVKTPQIFVTPVGYRAVRVYVGGEISRPGYYMLSGGQVIEDQLNIREGTSPNAFRAQSSSLKDFQSARLRLLRSAPDDITTLQGISSTPNRWPTLFDALRAAQGVTPYSDLAAVNVIRKQPMSQGGGKAQAQVNFLSLVTEGDESVNIRLFDGDVVKVGRSDELLRDQLLAASRTNLSPDFIEVFVSGRVKEPGPQSLPQGATLNQAIAGAGGTKLLRGGIEFLRFNPDGKTDRRQFSYNPSAKSGDFKNPVLMSGDVVRVNDSLLSAGVEVLNEITGPAVGIYSVYSLFKP
ncbi:polysaccharide biosynthesis/export family protein [Synechococcus sp. W4D4]|uniref:polysaccharide biosynthesis/export family protein n=1 Tax=Synechococcus sp. W4D4 TaxID=3392294 RepID=UPI0039E93646